MFEKPQSPPESGVQHLHRRLSGISTAQAVGKVVEACGTVLRVSGLPVRIGEVCRLYDPAGDWRLDAEVIGLSRGGALLTPLGHLRGMSADTRVEALGHASEIPVGDQLLGRVLDSAGLPIDGLEPPRCADRAPLFAGSPDPMRRAPVERPLPSGIRAVDSLLCCGEGQRFGIFASAGAGKSTLLGMLARGVEADVNVIALVGERGREVREFIEQNLAGSEHRSVVVVATSDEPPLLKVRAMYAATAIAEYFRDRGARVQLLVDSVTRYARALRDVGLAAGEPPARQGFPPSVFSTLPQLLERAGNNDMGSITAFYTVLVEDDDQPDPVAEEVRSILDGHIVLSRRLATENHYPAIDVLKSTSRLMTRLATQEHGAAAARARRLLAKYQAIELLVQMGEYQRGNDKDADAALDAAPRLTRHLLQPAEEHSSFEESLLSLNRAITAEERIGD